MMIIIARVLVIAFALVVCAAVVPGIEIAGLYSAIIAAIVLGLLNLFARPVLIILTLPVTLLSLGLFVFVINAALFWFAASFIEGFAVSGFVAALLGSLIVSVVSTVANRFLV